MSKRNKIIISVVILFLFWVIGLAKFSFSSGYKIYITNNTNETVETLELKYKVGKTIQTISQIEPKKSWGYTIDTNSLQGENAIILTYKNNKGNSYEECIVGYLENGYRGNVNVFINNIDKNGKLKMIVN